MNRYVEPKVISNPDGTVTLALSEESDKFRRQSTFGSSTSLDRSTPEMADPVVGLTAPDDDENEQSTIRFVKVVSKAQNSSFARFHQFFSLSFDDVIQYAQPMPPIIQDGGEIEEIPTKYVPVGMDEFFKSNNDQPSSPPKDSEVCQNDSGEFPDLLDSESNLSSLTAMDFTKFTQSGVEGQAVPSEVLQVC